VVKHTKALNRVLFPELEANANRIPEEFRLLQLIRRKLERYPESFAESITRQRNYDYQANASLAVLSHFPQATELSLCRLRRFGRPNVPCGVTEFCPYCDWIQGQELRIQYVPQFDQATWWFVTLSYENPDLAFKLHNFELHWEACRQALTQLVEVGRAEGALWVEEVAVLQFLPLRIIPHAHAVVVADDLTQEDKALLAQRMRGAVVKGRRLGCEPNIQARRISNEKDLNYTLGYMAKPIEIATPYAAAWQVHVADHPVLAYRLNEEATTFCEGLLEATFDRDRFRRIGRLHQAHGRKLTTP
jgi:hypothetical protein